jgi:hypothetical protein
VPPVISRGSRSPTAERTAVFRQRPTGGDSFAELQTADCGPKASGSPTGRLPQKPRLLWNAERWSIAHICSVRGGQATHHRPSKGQKVKQYTARGLFKVFTFVFMVCVVNTVVTIGAAIRMVVRDDRASKEISRAGNDFLARWTR